MGRESSPGAKNFLTYRGGGGALRTIATMTVVLANIPIFNAHAHAHSHTHTHTHTRST